MWFSKTEITDGIGMMISFVSNSNKQNHSYKISRSYKNFNEQILLQDLTQTNWNPILNTGDVDLSAEIFKGVLQPTISMFCALSQNYQHLFEEYLLVNCPRNLKIAFIFK